MPLHSSKPAAEQGGNYETGKKVDQVGNYEILEKIAEGGMGTVYKARHRDTQEIVAVKILAATARNPVLLQRFEQEFRVASMLDHPNVVRALEYCGEGSTPFLAMEYVDGESLGQRIERDGAMPVDVALKIIAQVCQGLHKAHRLGLIHRDVKPDNILINREGDAKLTDLGLVKDVENELNLTRTGRGLGTPHYMAPEQFRNAKNADVRCDVYSLAATLYAMVTGETPFGKCGPLDCWMKKHNNEFIPPRQVNPHLSERLDWAIRRGMSGDPENRPASCREFFEDLIGQSTRPMTNLDSGEPKDIWYLVYRDEEDVKHTVKGNTEAIRRALSDQLLGDAENVRACRSKQGPFEPLKTFPEFRDLIVNPSAIPPVSPPGSGRLPRTPRDPEAADIGGHVPATGGGSRHSRSGRIRDTAKPSKTKRDSSKAPRSGNRPRSGNSRLPHIPIKSAHQGGGIAEWFVWIVVTVVAVASAVLGAMYFR